MGAENSTTTAPAAPDNLNATRSPAGQKMGPGANPHAGAPGDRLKLTLKLEEIRSGQSREGDFYRIYKFSDEQSRRYSWISSSGPNSWFKGRTLQVRATVKKHTNFGHAETELTRVKIENVLSPTIQPSPGEQTKQLEVPVNTAAEAVSSFSQPIYV